MQAAAASVAVSRPSVRAVLSRRAPSAPSRAVVARATPAKPEPTFDFDKITADAVKRFEKAENKPVAAAWIFAFSAGILGAEYLMHLPLLNALLGFPVQLLGLLMLPYLGIRYLKDSKDPLKDVESVFEEVVKTLPGLTKSK